MCIVRVLAIVIAVVVALSLPGCGGQDYRVGDDPRGEVNGRSFEFISTKADGTEWTFRTRGNGLWVGYVGEEKVDDLGETALNSQEVTRLWELIEQVDVGGRRRGREDAKHGTVTMRLREPDGDGGHDLRIVRLSRRTDDEDVLALADFLIELVKLHHKVEPAF